METKRMAYYCFLCNEIHHGVSTEEHFIPRSINGPENQWLPVCKASNTRVNKIFDNEVRDIMYLERFNKIGILKRTGEALLSDGTLKQFKFSYDEPNALKRKDAFHYFFDRVSNQKIPSDSVCAVRFKVGLDKNELDIFFKGLAKISLGTLIYLLEKEGIHNKKLIKFFSQDSFDSLRHFALNLSGSRFLHIKEFSLGQTEVISRLQNICKDTKVANHVIEVNFNDQQFIQFDGMLYSRYGWRLILPTNINFDFDILHLENAILDLPAPEKLVDLTSSPNSIIIINPDYKGEKPPIPSGWGNNK